MVSPECGYPSPSEPPTHAHNSLCIAQLEKNTDFLVCASHRLIFATLWFISRSLEPYNAWPLFFVFFFLAVTSRASVYNCVIGYLDTFSKLFSKC